MEKIKNLPVMRFVAFAVALAIILGLSSVMLLFTASAETADDMVSQLGTLGNYDCIKFKAGQKIDFNTLYEQRNRYNKVFDIVYQNEFKYFVTLTLRESDKVDRRNPKDVMKALKIWLSNQVQRKGLQYILIPEYHPSSGAIHAHALINDCFRFEDSGRRIYHGKAWKIEDLEKYRVYTGGLKSVYNIPDWKYGFSTAIPLDGEVARVAYYITKYVTKDIKKIFGKFFWSSKNIVRDTDVHYMNVDYNAIPKKEYSPMYGLGFKYERHLLNDEDRKNEWDKEPDIDYGEIEWV